MVAHQNWIAQARAHWKEFQPKRFRALQETGRLDDALLFAAEQTSPEMGELRAMGFNHQESWEIVREKYLFPPEEGKQASSSGANPWL